jgi:hypothetical protein
MMMMIDDTVNLAVNQERRKAGGPKPRRAQARAFEIICEDVLKTLTHVHNNG